jgi:hypothetical protein
MVHFAVVEREKVGESEYFCCFDCEKCATFVNYNYPKPWFPSGAREAIQKVSSSATRDALCRCSVVAELHS